MASENDAGALTPAFENPELGSEQTFRAILEAMVQPGLLVKINHNLSISDSVNTASAAVCLTLLNAQTLLWSDLDWGSTAISWFEFHCRCSVVTEPCMAHFALITQPTSMPLLDDFKIGEDKHPASAATLIIQVEGFNDPNVKILGGPGIKSATPFAPAGVPKNFWEQWQLQAALFPLGVDIFFTCNDILAALPRTTQINNSAALAKNPKRAVQI
jgi:alpha-D-ribose 1-methylphosphonate 5-triphosphate synthase subunit PhnH